MVTVKSLLRPPPPVSLETVLERLDLGAYSEARDLAEKLASQHDLPDPELGGAAFVLGAVTAYEAGELPEKDRKAKYLVAASYLEQARVRGFPPDRKGEGLLLLAQSLFYSGQWVAARPVLKEALRANPDRKTQLYDMLVQAYAEAAPCSLKEALEYNTAYLADQWLTQAQKHQALLRQADLQCRLGDLEGCRKTLAQLPPEPGLRAGQKWIEGQIVLAEARAVRQKHGPANARQKYQEAIALFRQAQTDESLGVWAMRRAQYQIGLCLAEMGELEAAIAQWERVRAAFPESPEAVAAAWEEAELARQLQKPSEMLAAYRRAVQMIGLPKTFHNPWLSMEEIRARCLKAHQDSIAQKDFATAFSLAEAFARLFSPEVQSRLVAETLAEWARAEATKAETLPYPQRSQQQKQARKLFRQAGLAYQQLAELQKETRDYTNILWQSAENYLAGQAYPHAVLVLQEYLKQESRARRAAALVRLGEALLALGRIDEGLEVLTECIDFHPKDVAAYQARLLAARAWLEKGQPDKATQMLQANLDGRLAPSSLEWRQTLFAMGRLRHLVEDYSKAISLLEEAIQRYPDDPEALEARYLVADSYRRIGVQFREELIASEIRHFRLSRMKESQAAFQKALTYYKELSDILTQTQILRPLTTWEKVLQRNTLFGLGETADRLGEYEAALDAYTAAANRFQNEPTALIAYFQMAEVYRKLGQPDQARQMLRQAQLVLERLPEEQAFTKTTPFARTEWIQLLDRQLAELNPPGS
ncbi:MAG: tetratricopeptide repeat protein [Thermoguttaceae bacterium]|nr:tetratricopeptide repeat protein [Thermoguttaceae bacterium]